MDNNSGLIGMALGSWLVAAAVGTLAAVLLWVLGSWGFMQGAFMGFVVTVVVGLLISWVMTRPLPMPGEISARAPQPAAPAPAPAKPAAPATAAAPEATKPATAPKPIAKSSSPAPAASPVTAEKPKPAEKKAAPKKASPKASDARPTTLSDAAREGGADDLKLISGVGPKLEETLNSLGIWHFDQVAGLKQKDIAWVDERLRFKGRIERDDWVGQAKILAEGGETEFSIKKRKS
ncbi:hypothetical protein [Roseobacter sp.]|uniref:hypothetical protein n=1 Tax=Roseobacter sp. TaxID=1907202 RepID=UPI00385DD8C0